MKLIDIKEASQFLGVPKSWLYERTKTGASQPIPHYKLGKYLKFSESELIDWVKNLQRGMR